ncbi:MAG: hypothetical protein WD749_06385 [Phycisphaerales bacterium]
MSDAQQWSEVVRKLAQQTEHGELRWTLVKHVPDAAGERQVGPAYMATVGDRLIRVYEYEWQTSSDGETFYPLRDVHIEFVNREGQSLWSFPPTDERWKLWNAIRYRAVNADQFIEGFLKAS